MPSENVRQARLFASACKQNMQARLDGRNAGYAITLDGLIRENARQAAHFAGLELTPLSAGPSAVHYETAYGSTQRLSFSIKCF